MTKFAPSPLPISSSTTRRTVSAYSSSGTSKPPPSTRTGWPGSAASASASGISYASSATSTLSGVPSSRTSKPRSRICRKGTRARAGSSPTGRSARCSTSPTCPISTSTVSWSRPGVSRRSRANGGQAGSSSRLSRSGRLGFMGRSVLPVGGAAPGIRQRGRKRGRPPLGAAFASCVSSGTREKWAAGSGPPPVLVRVRVHGGHHSPDRPRGAGSVSWRELNHGFRSAGRPRPLSWFVSRCGRGAERGL